MTVDILECAREVVRRRPGIGTDHLFSELIQADPALGRIEALRILHEKAYVWGFGSTADGCWWDMSDNAEIKERIEFNQAVPGTEMYRKVTSGSELSSPEREWALRNT